jgi:hypothetical protein
MNQNFFASYPAKFSNLPYSFIKASFTFSNRTIPLLGKDDSDRIFAFGLLVAVVIPIQEGDYIRILFDLAVFSEVGKHWAFILPIFHFTA